MLKDDLRSLGLPNNDYVLDFLTLELFYNNPTRPVVANSIADIKVSDFETQLNAEDIANFQKYFPDVFPKVPWNSIEISKRDPRFAWKSIRISGKTSRFVWNPSQPEMYFIWKPTNGGPAHGWVASMLEEASSRDGLQVDFALEFGLSDWSCVRVMRTKFIQPEEHLYPVHGLITSPLFDQLVAKSGLSRFDFLNERFIPKFADFMFNLAFRVGIWGNSHTQNLWLVADDAGDFHFAHKDFEGTTVDHLSRHSDPTFAAQIEGRGAVPNENDLISLNSDASGGDNPRLTEPGFNFASYAIQTVTLLDSLTFAQRGQLLKAFFSRFVERVNAHFKIQVQFSENVQSTMNRLDTITHPYDIRGFSIWTSRGLFDRAGGLEAFSEATIREIYDQVFTSLLGARTYPQDKVSQKDLEQRFKDAKYYYQINPAGKPNLDIRADTRIEKFMLVPRLFGHVAFQFYRWSSSKVQSAGVHYESTPDFILEVTRSGKILSAAPIKPPKLSCKDLLETVNFHSL